MPPFLRLKSYEIWGLLQKSILYQQVDEKIPFGVGSKKTSTYGNDSTLTRGLLALLCLLCSGAASWAAKKMVSFTCGNENPRYDVDSWKRFVAPNMDVSENSGTPKSSILIGFSIINHPFWDTPIFGNTHMENISFFIGFYMQVVV